MEYPGVAGGEGVCRPSRIKPNSIDQKGNSEMYPTHPPECGYKEMSPTAVGRRAHPVSKVRYKGLLCSGKAKALSCLHRCLHQLPCKLSALPCAEGPVLTAPARPQTRYQLSDAQVFRKGPNLLAQKVFR